MHSKRSRCVTHPKRLSRHNHRSLHRRSRHATHPLHRPVHYPVIVMNGGGCRMRGQRVACKTPPAGGVMGRFGFEALVAVFAGLGCGRELHHVLAFLRLIELQRQGRDRGTASVGCMDRP
jgi:hypothetical protein